MIRYRPESTNIDRGGAIPCPMPQQSTIVLLYNFSKQKKKQQQQQNLGYGLCLGQS